MPGQKQRGFSTTRIHTLQENAHRDHRDRGTLNGRIGVRVPRDVIQNTCQNYKRYKKYQATFQDGKKRYKVLQVLIEREGKKPLVARWGGMRVTLGY